jgi:hypothetical protein
VAGARDAFKRTAELGSSGVAVDGQGLFAFRERFRSRQVVEAVLTQPDGRNVSALYLSY